MIDEDELNSPGSSFTLKQCFAAMRKHIHLILISSAIILATGIVSVSLLPNIYSATTTVLVDPQKIPERYVASTIDPNAQLNTLAQQVLSSSRLQEIIERYNLYSNLQTSSREEVIEYMRSKTKIDIKPSLEPEQGLSSFSITYENTDRAIVAVVTNQLAASFIAWNLKARQQQAFGTTEFLSSELDEAKKSLEEQETALQEYRMQHAGATPDALTGNLQALSRLQAESEANEDAISRLDQERILLSQTSSADPRVAPLTERDRLIQDKRRLEGELSELKRQFTDSYPDVISVKEQIKDASARLAAIPESSNTTDHLDSTTKVRLTLIGKGRLGTDPGITPSGAYPKL
jgi:succinoglycan biosynthesis transport protein ExoP